MHGIQEKMIQMNLFSKQTLTDTEDELLVTIQDRGVQWDVLGEVNQEFGINIYLCVCVLSCVHLFLTPWTVALQAPLSMEFSRQEYWSGLPFLIPEDPPDSGSEPTSLASPALAGGLFTTAPPGEPRHIHTTCIKQVNTRDLLFSTGDDNSVSNNKL